MVTNLAPQVPRLLVYDLQPPQKSERLLFWNGWNYCITNYGVEDSYGVISLQNFMNYTSWFKSY
jgi:hypothetical protein